MYPQILSWLRDTGKLTIRYILVGFAFVPAGLLYAELVRRGRESTLSMSLCLALGFVMANAVWKWSAAKRPAETVVVISQALAAALAGPTAQPWAVAVTMAEAHDREQMFTQVAGLRLVAARGRLHEASVRQVGFVQTVGAAHAAFSGIPS
jgi:hypothetical protein